MSTSPLNNCSVFSAKGLLSNVATQGGCPSDREYTCAGSRRQKTFFSYIIKSFGIKRDRWFRQVGFTPDSANPTEISVAEYVNFVYNLLV